MKDIVCPHKTEIDEMMFLKGTILRITAQTQTPSWTAETPPQGASFGTAAPGYSR